MKRLLIIFLGVVTCTAHAQSVTDSVRTLLEVNITDQRLEEYTTGSKIEVLEKVGIDQHSYANLTDLLRVGSAINIRSYGLSGLSTISFRGAGSGHSAMLWEGINLQSPSNGSVDLTLIPVSFIDKVTLQYGGGSSLFGSGAIGGTVHLGGGSYELDNPVSVSLHQQVGSFGSSYTGLKMTHSGKKYAIKLRGFTNHVDNDFKFYNEFTQRSEVQQNAELSQEGILFEGYYRSNRSQFVTKYWHQDNLVNLPKTKGQGLPSVAFQKDKFHRATLQWKLSRRKLDLNVKTAYVWHDLKYSNDRLDIFSNNLTKSFITEGIGNHSLGAFWKMQLGVNYTNETALVDGYEDFVPSRDRVALFSSFTGLLFNKLETTVSFRETYIDEYWSPFLPSFGFQYQISSQFSLKAKASKSYRVPTFNDLYWSQGGNPNLQPEGGTSFELGGQYSRQKNNISFESELTTFSNYVHDWILWTPLVNNIWSPRNIQEVWSKGLEFENQLKIQFNKQVKLETSVSYQLTDTRVEKIFDEKNNTINKQMILTPVHQSRVSTSVIFKSLNVQIQGNYTGRQFTDDNTRRGTLDDFMIWDFAVNQHIRLSQKNAFQVGVNFRNIFNHRYDVRKGYPMPGRNLTFTINYQFDNKLKI